MATRFREFFESGISLESIDREVGVIRNVKVIGLKSRNGRKYSESALRNGLPLYEGAKVYCDHSTSGRSIHERWGKLQNCSYRSGDGVYADLQFLKTSPATPAILEAIERFRDSGLSHDAEGIVESVDGENVVTKLERVHSVDFVEDPATNRNLFESLQMKSKILVVLREGIDQKSVAGILARLAETKTVGEDAEFEVSAESAKLSEAIAAAAGAVIRASKTVDEGIAAAVSLLAGGSVEGLQGQLKEATDKLAAVEAELKQVKESAEKAATRESCVKILESLEREVTDARVDAMMSIPAEKRTILAESWERKRARPDSSQSKFGSGAGSGGDSEGSSEIAESFDDFRKKIL